MQRIGKIGLVILVAGIMVLGWPSLFAKPASGQEKEQEISCRTLEGHKKGVNTVAFNPDGTLLASGSRDDTIKLWRVASGELIRTLKGHMNQVSSIAFSPDGTLLASVSNTFKLWRVANGEFIRTLSSMSKGHKNYMSSVTFSPDGTLLASGGWDDTIKLWRVATGELIRTLKGHTSGVDSVAFSPDGTILASGSRDKTIKLWRVASGELIRTLDHYDVHSVTFSPDGTLLASGGRDSTIKLWRVASGELIRTLERYRLYVNSVTFSPDGTLLASGGSVDNTIKLWQVATGEVIQTLKGHKKSVGSVAFSPDGKLLASGSDDKTIKLWDIVPKDKSGPTIEVLEPAGTTRGIDIVAKGQKMEVSGIAKDKSGVAYVRVNDKEAFLEPISEGVKFTAEVMLAVGDNQITVEAMDTKNNKTTEAFTIKREGKPAVPIVEKKPLIKPSLWCLAIGISSYKNPKLSLKYADYDAERIAASFKNQIGQLFREVHTKTFLNAQATRKNILKAMGSFLGQASSNDVVLIFIAGHGVKHKQTGSYYFLTYDAEPSNLLLEGLKWSDFEEAVAIIKGNVSKVVMLIDTCHAGAMQIAMRGAEAGEDLAETLRQAEGTYILSSSKGGEESEEGKQFKFPDEPAGKGHGAFTYAILKGLRGEADLQKDGNITIFELNAYVGEIVPKITKGKQHPYPKTAGTDMPIYLTK